MKIVGALGLILMVLATTSCQKQEHPLQTASGVAGATGEFSNRVAIYESSDSCNGNIVALIDSRTRCEHLSDSTRAWSLRINDQCRDISDTNVRAACFSIQAELPGNNAIYENSDSCNGNVAAIVTRRTRCEDLSDSTRAWSIRVNGQCRDISDTTVRNACFAIQTELPGRITIYENSDSCNGTIAALIDSRTRCESLSDSTRAWSVRVNGECRDISDTNVRAACFNAQAELPGNNAIYDNSDSCNGNVVAVVTRRTRCENLSESTRAWSIRVNGQCRDISDTNVRQACFQIQAGG